MIHVLAHTANLKGDTFTDRVKELVAALGYVTEFTNLSRTGREVDIIAKHRYEARRAIFECKAQSEPISGSDLNKFAGVLDAERRRFADEEVSGYFVSLSGFKDSALAQEQDLGGSRFTLIDTPMIERELISGRILGSRISAATSVTQALSRSKYRVLEQISPLATDFGWVWYVPLTLDSGTAEAFCLVHSDGHVLETGMAEKIIDTGLFDQPLVTAETATILDLAEYEEAVRRESGTVSHEGLPADQQATQLLSLESLYVPLQFEEWRDDSDLIDDDGHFKPPTPAGQLSRAALSEALRRGSRVAFLGAPGAGKSTLLRRLAIACVNENDPLRDSLDFASDALPVVVRGRDISEQTATVWQLIRNLPLELILNITADEFERDLAVRLRLGKVLLLVDGLDEIASESTRLAFVRNLAAFLSTYPQITVAISSREPGFRAVVGTVNEHCTTWRISDLSAPAVRDLVKKWHDLVPKRTSKVASTPDQLATKILSRDRLRRIAVNPLLLTTLLLVERWVGDLPRRRSVLYDKAIEVLLITWNIEGHEPLDTDEVMPQLAYVAYEMTRMGEQRVSNSTLSKLLSAARREMPDVLGYSRMGPNQLIERIESRSSLLIKSGHSLEDGRLEPNFEFKHLTFQEYLAALAVSQGWLRKNLTSNRTAALRQHYGDPAWSEVIPLASVLFGRGATALVEDLLQVADNRLEAIDPDADDPWDTKYSQVQVIYDAAAACLADDAQVSPSVAAKALDAYITFGQHDFGQNYSTELLGSRYADELRARVRFASESDVAAHASSYAGVAADILLHDYNKSDAASLYAFMRESLQSSEPSRQFAAAGLASSIAYRLRHDRDSFFSTTEIRQASTAVARLRHLVIDRLESDSTNPPVTVAANWAANWMFDGREYEHELHQRFLNRCAALAYGDNHGNRSSFSHWGVATAGLVPLGAVILVADETWLDAAETILDSARPSPYLQQRVKSAAIMLFHSQRRESNALALRIRELVRSPMRGDRFTSRFGEIAGHAGS